MTTPLDQLTPGRIAVVKPSALGDIVHSLPVLSALRARFPGAHISWVVNRSYEPLLAGHPDLDATLPFERSARRGWWATARAAGAFVADLRRQRFDLVLDLQGLLRSGLMTLATAAPRRVGLSTAREGASLCYTDVVRVDAAAVPHAVDRLWRAAEALGAGGGPKRFVVPVSDAARAWADAALAALPRPLLALAVGARWVTKRWPAAHFAELARRAQAANGGGVVFVGSAEDAPAAAEAAAGLSGPSLDLSGRTTLPQLAAVLGLADAVLANDTGPLHLAAALGRPVVAPFTCTRPARHGPYGQLDRTAATGVACAGSYLKTCRRMVCMGELTPGRLWPALDAALNGRSRRPLAG